jgi:putative colanic acid biosynthesis UDP-glucose lipid carrier transferase
MALLPEVHRSMPYMLLSVAINISWIVCSYTLALYIGKQNSYANFFKRTIQTFLSFLFFILLFIFFYHYSYSRLFTLASLSAFLLILLISRVVLLGSGYLINKRTIQRQIAIIGCNDVAKRLIKHFSAYSKTIRIHGCFDEGEQLQNFEGVPALGNINRVLEYAINNDIHEIYSTVSPEINTSIYTIAEEAENNFIKFKFVPDFRIFINRSMHVELQKDIPILSMWPDPLEDKGQRFKKRLFDIVFTFFVTLFILWWLIPLVAILIKLESKGPVFFKQLRSGKNNKPFYCYKFRSLKVNNESDSKQVSKTDNRFTRIGKFLRKTNIDELPQFLNVWQNTMSVVGPRPHMLHHTSEWSKVSRQYMLRHYLKPGITGWAQVNGFRGEVKSGEALIKRVEHDIWYMENWSMWLDMRIIILSVFKTVSGDENAV